MKGLVNWKALQDLHAASFHKRIDENPAGFWGQTAAMYNKMAQLEEDYTKNQLETIIVEPSDSVLDIGCGPGRLAVPMARKAARVTALDVAPEMLEKCQENARLAGVGNLQTLLLNWDDAAIGENIEKHDVVIASRSTGMFDLIKLNSAAKKYVFVLSFAQSPSLKEARDSLFIGASDKVTTMPPSNRMFGYNITFNIIYDMGIDPSVKVVQDGFCRSYTSRLAAYDDLRELCEFPAENENIFRQNVDQWLNENDDGTFTFRIETKTFIIWWQPQKLRI